MDLPYRFIARPTAYCDFQFTDLFRCRRVAAGVPRTLHSRPALPKRRSRVREITGTNRKGLILLAGSRLSAILLFPIVAAGMGRSLSPDLRLITLVPSDAQMVAGIGAPTLHGQQPSTFLL